MGLKKFSLLQTHSFLYKQKFDDIIRDGEADLEEGAIVQFSSFRFFYRT